MIGKLNKFLLCLPVNFVKYLKPEVTTQIIIFFLYHISIQDKIIECMRRVIVSAPGAKTY